MCHFICDHGIFQIIAFSDATTGRCNSHKLHILLTRVFEHTLIDHSIKTSTIIWLNGVCMYNLHTRTHIYIYVYIIVKCSHYNLSDKGVIFKRGSLFAQQSKTQDVQFNCHV